jgi:hypothetical protein
MGPLYNASTASCDVHVGVVRVTFTTQSDTRRLFVQNTPHPLQALTLLFVFQPMALR